MEGKSDGEEESRGTKRRVGGRKADWIEEEDGTDPRGRQRQGFVLGGEKTLKKHMQDPRLGATDP